MVVPTGGITGATEIVTEPDRTYKIDTKTGRITGYIDGLDAVKQAVFKILQTERFIHSIYSSNFGSEGIRSNSITPELETWIRDALTQDDRIEEIEDFRISSNGDSANVSFTVVSIYGNFPVSTGGVTDV